MIATFVIARHLMDWPFAAAAAALTAVWGWFLVAPNFYTWEATFFALAALLLYLRHTQSPERAWLIGAGLATGTAFLVKQNIGAYAVSRSVSSRGPRGCSFVPTNVRA